MTEVMIETWDGEPDYGDGSPEETIGEPIEAQVDEWYLCEHADEQPCVGRIKCYECDHQHEADARLGAAVRKMVLNNDGRDWPLHSWSSILETWTHSLVENDGFRDDSTLIIFLS